MLLVWLSHTIHRVIPASSNQDSQHRLSCEPWGCGVGGSEGGGVGPWGMEETCLRIPEEQACHVGIVRHGHNGHMQELPLLFADLLASLQDLHPRTSYSWDLLPTLEGEGEIYSKSHISWWEHSSHFRPAGRGVHSVSVVSQPNRQKYTPLPVLTKPADRLHSVEHSTFTDV